MYFLTNAEANTSYGESTFKDAVLLMRGNLNDPFIMFRWNLVLKFCAYPYTVTLHS